MKWTTTIPNKETLPERKGYYFYRSDKRLSQPVSVYLEGDTFWITFIGDRKSYFLGEVVAAENGEFLGPIQVGYYEPEFLRAVLLHKENSEARYGEENTAALIKM